MRDCITRPYCIARQPSLFLLPALDVVLLHRVRLEGCAVVAVVAETVVVERGEQVGETCENDGPDALLSADVSVCERLVQCDDVGTQGALDPWQRASEDAASHDAQRVLRRADVDVHCLVREAVHFRVRPVGPVSDEHALRHVAAKHGGPVRTLAPSAEVPRIHPQMVTGAPRVEPRGVAQQHQLGHHEGVIALQASLR